MADRISVASFRNTLETFKSYLADLRGNPEREDMGAAVKAFEEHSTKLRLLVNFCTKDDGFHPLSERLLRQIPTDAVVERALAEKLELPRDPLLRLAFSYNILLLLKQKHRLDLREFLSRAFAGSTIEDRWRDLRRRLLGPFTEDVAALAARCLEMAGDQDVIEHDSIYARAIDEMRMRAQAEPPPAPAPAPVPRTAVAAPVAPVAAPVAASAPATPSAPSAWLGVAHADGRAIATVAPVVLEGGGALTWGKLLRAAAAALAPAESRADLAVDAELLELELSKARPNERRVTDLVRGFEEVGETFGALARATARVDRRKSE